MGIWSKLGDVAKTIGKGAASGGKWAFEHAEQIADVAEVGIDIHNKFFASNEGNNPGKYGQESSAKFEVENDVLQAVVQEIQAGISELEVVFETAIQEVDKKCDTAVTKAEELKLNLTKSVANLQEQLDKNREDLLTYQKQMNQDREYFLAYQKHVNKMFVMVSIIGTIGIALATIIAIVAIL